MIGDQSFGIRTAKDFADNLVRPDLDSFRHQSLDPGVAIRVAVSFNQLAEWAFEDRGSVDFSKIGASIPSILKNFRNEIESICPELRWLRDIANGSKHCIITNYSPQVMGSNVAEWGQLAWGEFPSDRPVLAIRLISGEYKNYEDVIDRAASFWGQIFPRL